MASFSHLLVTGLAVFSAVSTALESDSVITNDTHFYGQSPPVYPTRKMSFSSLDMRKELIRCSGGQGNRRLEICLQERMPKHLSAV